MSFSTQDCKDLLISIFNKTHAKDWKRLSKNNINGVVTRMFSHPFAGQMLLKEVNNALVFEPAKYIPQSRVFSPDEIHIGSKILHSYSTGSEYDHRGNLLIERDEKATGNYEFSYDIDHILNNSFFKKHLYCIAPHFSFSFPEDTYANDTIPASIDEEKTSRYNDFFCFHLISADGDTEMNGAELLKKFFPIHLNMMDESHFNIHDDFPFDTASLRLIYNTLISSGFRHNPDDCILLHLLGNLDGSNPDLEEEKEDEDE